MEGLSFHFGTGDSKIDPKLDSLFKNSVNFDKIIIILIINIIVIIIIIKNSYF